MQTEAVCSDAVFFEAVSGDGIFLAQQNIDIRKEVLNEGCVIWKGGHWKGKVLGHALEDFV